MKPLILYDRSGVTLDWKCPHAFYLNRISHSRGLVTTGLEEDLELGISLHAAIAATIDSGGNASVIDAEAIRHAAALLQKMASAPPARGEVVDLLTYGKERAALCEGFIRGWWRVVWPRLQLSYKVSAVEQEMHYIADGTMMQTKPDLLLEEFSSNLLGYMEWKTTGLNTPGWFDSWNYAAQLHSGGAAVLQTTGKKVDFAVVQGLYKGVYQDGWQHSPFCYCWVSQATEKDFDIPLSDAIYDEANNLLISAVYRRGARWQRLATWEMPHGLAWWVEVMPIEVLSKQFPTTQPIFLNAEKATEFFDQTIPRVIEIDAAKKSLAQIGVDLRDGVITVDEAVELEQRILRRRFPRHTDQCSPAIGRKCQYWRICHSPIGNDPLGSGYYQLRTPHHEAERKQFGLEEEK